ncbi:MAG: hypothetical protein HY842_12990 [Bacteroidetes bacterium]|nr:hypothetical protein [Bacteroidota bacterium]
MKNAIRHIAVYLLAGIVFIATTGLSVHHLYCYCKGEIVTSIFRPDGSCGMAENATQRGCCKGTACIATANETQHKCADCTSEFVKLDVKYLPTFSDLKLTLPAAPQVVHVACFEIPVAEKTAIGWERDIPPPAGKELLPWVQSFLC